jgi:hypothetical protein
LFRGTLRNNLLRAIAPRMRWRRLRISLPKRQGRALARYADAVAQAKETAKQAADATAKAVSRGALFGAIALLPGALAAFFGGRAGALNPTITDTSHSGRRSG